MTPEEKHKLLVAIEDLTAELTLPVDRQSAEYARFRRYVAGLIAEIEHTVPEAQGRQQVLRQLKEEIDEELEELVHQAEVEQRNAERLGNLSILGVGLALVAGFLAVGVTWVVLAAAGLAGMSALGGFLYKVFQDNKEAKTAERILHKLEKVKDAFYASD